MCLLTKTRTSGGDAICIKNINKGEIQPLVEESSEDQIVTEEKQESSVSWMKNELLTKFEKLPESQKAAALIISMFFFFGVHNLLQEAIMKSPGFEFGVMLGYFEVLGVAICASLERRYVAKESGRVAPLSAYPILTFCLFASSSFSNLSLNYINFPTKVVFRSCKLLPTMLIATVMNKSVFSSSEYMSAIGISLGLIMFTAADWQTSPSFNPIGLLCVSLSVCADSILPNFQQKLFASGASRLEVTVYSNILALIAMTCTTLWSGDLIGTLQLALSDQRLFTYIAVYTFVAYVAVSTYMQIVKRYGGVAAVLVATARKAMTLILSFILFPKAFSWLYVFGAMLVLGGLLYTSLLKQKKKNEIKEEPSQSTKEIDIETGKDSHKHDN